LLAHCKGLDNTFKCARAIEAAQYKVAHWKHFQRDGMTLQLQTAQGALSFVDDDTEGDDTIYYSYLAYLPSLKTQVLHLQYWEGSSYMVVHYKSGAKAYVDGFPNVAPNSQRFASISSAGESGYYPNSIEIWRVAGGSFVSEFRWTPDTDEWSPEGAVWLDAQNLKLRGSCTPSAAMVKKCFAYYLRRKNDKWSLERDR